MSYPSYEHWFASLSPEEQERTNELVSKLRALGAVRPEDWARSEISEDIPQFARFLILRKIWPDIIDRWRREPGVWIDRLIEIAERNPKERFADAGLALKRMRQSGVSAEDIASVTRMAAYEAVFDVLDTIDTGCDFDSPFEGPDWSLMEVRPDGELTGRLVGGLHEDILSMDPSRREGSPEG